MTKSELATHVARSLPYVTREDAEIIVDVIFESMADALVRGDRIEIRGFGSFKVNNRPERERRNPMTGEAVHIPAKKLPHFKVGKELHGRINQIAPSAGSMEQDS